MKIMAWIKSILGKEEEEEESPVHTKLKESIDRQNKAVDRLMNCIQAAAQTEESIEAIEREQRGSSKR